MKRIVLTVTTDLVFDQRMRRICHALSDGGYDILLVGRVKKNSPELNSEPYQQKRIKCFYEKGAKFYIEYNIRLFLFLLFHKADIFCGIDLDAVLPPFYASKIKGKPFVHDAHEYFTEMEELVDRPRVQKIWKRIEKLILPHVKYGYTVSEGYANLFNKNYGINLQLVRNVAVLKELPKEKTKQKIILYQGAVNVGRGLESLVEAMHKIDAQLVICGMGDIYKDLNEKVVEEGLSEKVSFMGYVEPDRLIEFTRNAYIGITLFQANGLSNKYSLANRFFDYLHSGVPQLAMNYPEYKNFNTKFEVATLLDDLEPFSIASGINHLLKDELYYNRLRDNALLAREEINWQKESETLLGVYEKVVQDSFR